MYHHPLTTPYPNNSVVSFRLGVFIVCGWVCLLARRRALFECLFAWLVCNWIERFTPAAAQTVKLVCDRTTQRVACPPHVTRTLVQQEEGGRGTSSPGMHHSIQSVRTLGTLGGGHLRGLVCNYDAIQIHPSVSVPVHCSRCRLLAQCIQCIISSYHRASWPWPEDFVMLNDVLL